MTYLNEDNVFPSIIWIKIYICPFQLALVKVIFCVMIVRYYSLDLENTINKQIAMNLAILSVNNQ